jgi:hypothetical protein
MMQAAVVAARANDEDESKRKRAHSLAFGSAGEGRGEMFALDCGHNPAHDFLVLFINGACLAHFSQSMFEIRIDCEIIPDFSRNKTSCSQVEVRTKQCLSKPNPAVHGSIPDSGPSLLQIILMPVN